MSQYRPEAAMVYAAGLGTRMRPLTDRRPKALLEAAGRALVDRAIDRAVDAGVERVVVNCHHFAAQMRCHLDRRNDVDIHISEEPELLETGGGAQAALPMIGERPFLAINCDSLWTDGSALAPLLESWLAVEAEADALLLLAHPRQAVYHLGKGDFAASADSRLKRFGGDGQAMIYTGAQILDPCALRPMPDGCWSLNALWDRAIERRRLFGASLAAGRWVDAGTPEGLKAGEAAIRAELDSGAAEESG